MTNIVGLRVARLNNAYLTTNGISLNRSWGSIEFDKIALPAGWYQVETSDIGSTFCLQLSEHTNYSKIEVFVKSGQPAVIYLTGGDYEPELFPGVRAGKYPLTNVEIKKLPVTSFYTLLAGRAWHAIMRGVSLANFFRLAQNAIRPKNSFGVRLLRNDENGTSLDLPKLTSVDKTTLVDGHSGLPLPSEPKIFVSYKTRPIHTAELGAIGLNDQTYRNFQTGSHEGCSWAVYLSDSQRFTPDALSTFVSEICHKPEAQVIIADAWEGSTQTARVGFDPVLYTAEDYPTPFATRLGFNPGNRPWQTLEPNFAAVNVPLASGPKISTFRPNIRLPIPKPKPFVSIIIPTRDRADLLAKCLAGLFGSTHWPHEVIILDNGSKEKATFDLLNQFSNSALKVVNADFEFNFSKLCNLGAANASGEYLVFMNNDIELADPDWLAQMMRYAVLKDVGAVGARLLYSDKSLQHGGVALGLTEICGHLWRNLSYVEQSEVEQIRCSSLRSAVTGALLCVNRTKFDAVGGFDEVCFPVTLNDIDLCLKLYRRGWYTVYAAKAEAYHHEGKSRGLDETFEKRSRRLSELQKFEDKWRDQIANDPWLPKSVMRSTEKFGLK